MHKQKRRLMIFAIITLLVVLLIMSCDLFKSIPDILKGAGIWGKSRYGKAIFGTMD